RVPSCCTSFTSTTSVGTAKRMPRRAPRFPCVWRLRHLGNRISPDRYGTRRRIRVGGARIQRSYRSSGELLAVGSLAWAAVDVALARDGHVRALVPDGFRRRDSEVRRRVLPEHPLGSGARSVGASRETRRGFAIMKSLMISLIIGSCMLGVTEGTAMAETVNFDQDKTGAPPAGWKCGVTGRGSPKWTVEKDD